MTLTIQIEELEQQQQRVLIEVPEERVKKEMRKSARKLAYDLHIPGFRRGKAPYRVVVKRVGEANLRVEAYENLVQPLYDEAIAQEGITVYGQPSFNDIKQEPLRFVYTISLPPTVELGDYRALRRDVDEVNISEEAVDEAINSILEEHVILEDVDRPVEAGDLVLLDGRGELLIAIEEDEDEDVEETAVDLDEDDIDDIDDEEEDEDWSDSIIFDEENTELVMDSNELFPGTPFVDNIVGLSAGESCEFTFTFPDDYTDEELAGKEAEFNIDVINVQSRTLPELTDAFVLELEQKAKTVAELREKTKKLLIEQAEHGIRSNLLDALGKDLVAGATITYPQNAVEMKIDGMVEDAKAEIEQSGWKMEDYLRLQGQGEDEFREEFRESATARLRTNLAFEEFLKREKIAVSMEDLEAKIEKLLDGFTDDEELRNAIRGYYEQGQGLDEISSQVLMEKTADRYADILTGNAPDLDLLDAVDTAVDEGEEE